MADFTGRIRRVRIRQEGEGSNEYRTIVVVGDDTTNQVVKVQVEFSKEAVPAPTVNPETCPFKRKNAKNGNRRFVNVSTLFKDNAVDAIYEVLVTMLNVDGKPLAAATPWKVTVEASDDADEDVEA